MWQYLLAAIAGAGLTYFLDPDRGKRRRNIARDRAMAFARQASRQLGTKARYASSTAQGLAEKVTQSGKGGEAQPNDATLAQKIESEIFRDPGVPKGKINVNVEYGQVVLRGEMDRPEDISALEEKVRRIEGVAGVENLLHLPNVYETSTSG